ncbi:EAL domain-containing protein [Rhizobium jaguaris]|nr:EAL domain-containing protein [Rhizobium jaguaris]
MAVRHSERDVPEGITIETARKATLRKLMKLAIDQRHLRPAFQPIVDIRTGCIVSSEIPACWGNSQVGEICPMTFIPRLEQYGPINVLSDALRNAFNKVVTASRN